MNIKEKSIVIKQIPGHWDKIKQACYVFIIGETDNEAGKRLIVPYHSTLGKKIDKDYYVNVKSSSNELTFGSVGLIPSTYKMKLIEELRDGAKAWEIKKLEKKHWELLDRVSITPNESMEELYIKEA